MNLRSNAATCRHSSAAARVSQESATTASLARSRPSFDCRVGVLAASLVACGTSLSSPCVLPLLRSASPGLILLV